MIRILRNLHFAPDPLLPNSALQSLKLILKASEQQPAQEPQPVRREAESA